MKMKLWAFSHCEMPEVRGWKDKQKVVLKQMDSSEFVQARERPTAVFTDAEKDASSLARKKCCCEICYHPV